MKVSVRRGACAKKQMSRVRCPVLAAYAPLYWGPLHYIQAVSFKLFSSFICWVRLGLLSNGCVNQGRINPLLRNFHPCKFISHLCPNWCCGCPAPAPVLERDCCADVRNEADQVRTNKSLLCAANARQTSYWDILFGDVLFLLSS